MNIHFFLKFIFLCFFLSVFSFLSWSQTPVPADLMIIGSTGGGERAEEHRLLQITADGKGSYLRYLPDSVLAPPLEENAFTLSQQQVAEIWNEIGANDFFNLDSAYTDTSITGGSSLRLSILANGTTYTVYAKNQVVPELDNIIAVINSATPGGSDLIYDPAIAPVIITKYPCVGKFRKGDSQPDPDILRKMERSNDIEMQKMPRFMASCDYHPGTVVSCQLSIQQAVEQGMVSLKSKGMFNGDAISITSSNNGNNQKCNEVNIKLYIEFWGPGVTASNVQGITDAIEKTWNGLKTSDGRTLKLELITRSEPGATSPPGTQGYHQIMLDENVNDNVVYGLYNGVFGVNQGTGSGEWNPLAEPEIFAHEAGHFLGFPDYYDDYTKLTGERWINKRTNNIITTAQLAQQFVRDHPEWTLSERQNFLENKRVGQEISLTKPNHEQDIMAHFGRSVQQGEIDQLAASTGGILITIPAGSVVTPKNGSVQSLVVTKSEEVYVPAGQSKTCGGLYGSCIDEYNLPSNVDETLDLSPSVDLWSGFDGAPLLLQLVRYIDGHGLYCLNFDAAAAIWRLTNNKGIGKSNVDGFLLNAGIVLGTRLLDFPRMSSPDPTDTNTTFIIPPQLYLPKVTPASTLTQVGSTVRLTGSFTKFSLIDSSAQFGWSLLSPNGSQAKLSNPKSDTLGFTPDVRGVYYPAFSLTTQKSGRSPFTVSAPVNARVVAADALTETFESGTLRSGSPFFWATSTDAPWRVIDSVSHSGTFAVQGTLSPLVPGSELTVKFSIPDSDRISFAYWVSSVGGNFEFYINDKRIMRVDTLTWGYSNTNTNGWNYVSIPMSPGVNTLKWSFYHVDNVPEVMWLDDIFFPRKASFMPTAVEQSTLPTEYSLSQNYPNPFGAATLSGNAETAIKFSIPTSQIVTLTVYDMLGREVQVLVDERKSAGSYSINFNISKLPGGVYFYKMTAGAFSTTKSMVVLK